MSSRWQRLRHDVESHSPSPSPRRLGRHVPSRDGLELVEWVFSYSGSLGEISPACRGNSPQARIAASSSRKAVSFQSARTTKRFPLSRCASAIQIVRPLESIAETQPQLQPALLRLSAISSQYFTNTRTFDRGNPAHPSRSSTTLSRRTVAGA